MKQFIVNVDDLFAETFKNFVGTIEHVKIVSEKSVDSIDEFRRQSSEVRLDYALRQIVTEKDVIKHQYDYAWLYAAIQGGLMEHVKPFRSVKDFLNHLRKLEIAKIPSNSIVSDNYRSTLNKETFPDWKFPDCGTDETDRRIQVVKRFLALYNKGK